MDPQTPRDLVAAWDRLREDDLASAAAALRHLSPTFPSVANALAVLRIREGNIPAALDLLRPLVLPNERETFDDDADPACCANFCLALLLGGNRDGFIEHVPRLTPADHPAVRCLTEVLTAWHASCARLPAFKRLLGIQPPLVLPPGTPLGWPDAAATAIPRPPSSKYSGRCEPAGTSGESKKSTAGATSPLTPQSTAVPNETATPCAAKPAAPSAVNDTVNLPETENMTDLTRLKEKLLSEIKQLTEKEASCEAQIKAIAERNYLADGLSTMELIEKAQKDIAAAQRRREQIFTEWKATIEKHKELSLELCEVNRKLSKSARSTASSTPTPTPPPAPCATAAPCAAKPAVPSAVADSPVGQPASATKQGDSPAIVWKARPVFLSSTFRDMHQERDWLRGHVFLALSEQLRERCHTLDTIDLRQGVESVDQADESAREMQVLKVCLDEIERSKPFLVALLGDRYGWIPPKERITAAARAAGLPEQVDVAGRSVTELEILYGILENKEQRKRSWVYIRTVDPTGMPQKVADAFLSEPPSDDPDSPAGRLSALKTRLRKELPGRVRDYTLRWDAAKQAVVGFEELDAQVSRDLWSDLEPETAAYLRQAPRTWQEADARAVADFVAERTRGYVERPAATDPMLVLALSSGTAGASGFAGLCRDKTSPLSQPEWGLSVTGESGCGKSSLFGRVYDTLLPRSEKGELILLSHAAGIFPQSGSVDRMLKRWIAELAAFLNITDPIDEWERSRLVAPAVPDSTAGVTCLSEYARSQASPLPQPAATAEQIDKAFADLLGRAAARARVVVLVDALNQFENTVRAQHLTWLPKPWPANARLLATAIPCAASDTLAARPGCAALAVPPVTEPEAREIARRYCRERFHRDIHPLVLDTLLAKTTDASIQNLPSAIRNRQSSPAYSNPLWLSLALQEMNLLEADDYERADRLYATLPGAERMRRLQLDTAAGLPADAPGLYAELLARAKRGFGQTWADAFASLIAISRAGWRESDFEALMPLLSGQPWESLAFAGLRRIFGPHVVQRGAYAQWDFFHAVLRDTVLSRNLADEAARRRLHGHIADHLLGLPASDPLRTAETMFHLVGLGDRDRAAEYLSTAGATSPLALAAAVSVLVDALRAAPDDTARDRLTDWLASLLDSDDDTRIARVANVFLFALNDALAVTGESRTEVPRGRLLAAARASLESLVVANPSNTEWQYDLSVSHNMVGHVLRSQGDLTGALKAYRESLRHREHLAAVDPSNLVWQPGLSLSHTNIGQVLLAQGDLWGALTAYRESLVIDAKMVAAYPSSLHLQRALSVSQNNIGDVLLAQGDLAGALQAYRQSLAVAERLTAADPSNAGWQRDLSVSQNNIGDVLRAQGDLAGGLKAYRESLGVRERLALSDPSNAGWQRDLSVSHIKIGDVLRAQGDLAGGLKAYREALAIAERLALSDPSNAGWQCDLSVSHNKIGDVLLAQGDLAGGLKAYRESLEVTGTLAASAPSNKSWQYDLSACKGKIGDVLRAQGDLAGALEAYREYKSGMQYLTKAFPSNVDYQSDFGVSNERIGKVLFAQGDLFGALQAYRESLGAAEPLAAKDKSNTGWQRNLFVSYWCMAEISEHMGQGDAKDWWRKAYEQLADMKQRGIMLSKDERFLSILKQLLEM